MGAAGACIWILGMQFFTIERAMGEPASSIFQSAQCDGLSAIASSLRDGCFATPAFGRLDA